MTPPHRLKCPVLAVLCLLASEPDALRGQCSPVAGSLINGPNTEKGTVKWRDSISLEEVRKIDYAVVGNYQKLTYQDCPAMDPFLGATSDFNGVELLTNSCYVKMTKPPQKSWVDLSLGPGEIVSLVLRDPDRFGPVVLGALRVQLGLTGPEQEGEWKDVAKTVWEAIQEAAQGPPQRFAEREAFAPIRSTTAEVGVAGLVRVLRTNEATELRQLIVVKLIYALATIDPQGLPMLTEMTKFPFIVAKRTIGGAEGTEIVVYIKDGPSGANPATAEVYYFYLASNTGKPITVCGVRLVDGFEIEYGDSSPVSLEQFAHLHLVQKPLNRVRRWYLDGPIRTAMIRDITQADELAAFTAAVKPSYDLACAQGLSPTSPLTYLGVTLKCP